MGYVGLAGAGIALGGFLEVVSRLRVPSKSRLLPFALLFARLVLFASVVAWCAQRFGSSGAFAVLAGAISARLLSMLAPGLRPQSTRSKAT